MAQPSGGEGQAEVDWDAVFRTIDHQQEQGTNVAVAVGGTLQSGEGGPVEYTPWSTVPVPVHARRGPGNEEDQSDAELLQYFGQQWNQGGPSNQRRETQEPRTMDPTSGLGYGIDSDSGHAPSTEYSSETYDLAFRAMLGENNGDVGMVPPPQNRSLGSRRRSRSMGPRRSLSDSESCPLTLIDRMLMTSTDGCRIISRSFNLLPLFLAPQPPLKQHHTIRDASSSYTR